MTLSRRVLLRGLRAANDDCVNKHWIGVIQRQSLPHQRRLVTSTIPLRHKKCTKFYSALTILVSAGMALGATCMQQEVASCSTISSPSSSSSNSTSKSVIIAPIKEVLQLRPSCDGENPLFERIDEKFLAKKEFAKIVPKNLVHDTLNGKRMIETYEIYRKQSSDEVWAVITFGDLLNGHPNYVHGGMISTMIDMTYGWLFFACGFPAAMTANLNVDFRKPIPANSTVLLKTKLKETKGRKLYMTATMEDINGNILAESTSLFIVMRKRYRYLAEIRNYLGF